MSKQAGAWRVRDVMSEDVVSTTPATPFKVLVEQLLLDGVTALPVLDADGRIVGVVSETDLIVKEEHEAGGEAARWARQLLEAAGDHDGGIVDHTRARLAKAAGRTAAAVMTSPAITIDPDASLGWAATVMHRRGVNQVPVVDHSGRLIGIVTRGDLLKVFMRTDQEIQADATAAIRGVLNEPEAVTVTVTDGIVALRGELASQLEAEAAEAAVAAVPGVVAVDDDVRALI